MHYVGKNIAQFENMRDLRAARTNRMHDWTSQLKKVSHYHLPQPYFRNGPIYIDQ